MNTEELSRHLRNIGPVMAEKLIKAGIDSPTKLKKCGAKKAFLKIHESGGFCGLFNAAYLYALEGAITDCDWRCLPPPKNKSFETLQKNFGRINVKVINQCTTK